MNIYTGNDLALIRSKVGLQTCIFEEVFSQYMSSQYKECWLLWPSPRQIICKTLDAIRAAPDNSVIIRIGTSIRISDGGEILENILSQRDYLWFHGVTAI